MYTPTDVVGAPIGIKQKSATANIVIFSVNSLVLVEKMIAAPPPPLINNRLNSRHRRAK